jgi:transcription antitermination factor NusG
MSHLHTVLNFDNSSSTAPFYTDTGSPDPSRAEKLSWYGVHTRSNHEKVTANVLSAKGYHHYLPTYKSRKRWSDRVVETDKPLFPGYVFCRFDPKVRLPILTTPGVVSVVGFGNEPAPIDDLEIQAVQAVLRAGLHAEPCSYLREGQRIRVNQGSLMGLEGILMRKKSEWRMVVSVAMLQRSISVEIDREWIDPINN